MAKTREYHHFCPVARSLEVIGEKWSLLIVRDLLRGPQRFTDLQRYLGAITPKWLTLRLRDLEAAGIIVADREEGRREVWYRLTPAGQDLAPVVEALAIWGLEHAMRPPLPGEPVHPERAITVQALNLNRRGIRPPGPVTWAVRFPPDRVHAVTFDGERWKSRLHDVEDADVWFEATPEAWVGFLLAPMEERRHKLAAIKVNGEPEAVRTFLSLYLPVAEVAEVTTAV